MAKNPAALVDTDILIKIYRGDKEKRNVIEPIQDSLAVSVITIMELLAGAKSNQNKFEILKTSKAYHVFHLSDMISEMALNLSKKYSVKHNSGVADILTAATAIAAGVPFYTDNTRHFEFIEELTLYKSDI